MHELQVNKAKNYTVTLHGAGENGYSTTKNQQLARAVEQAFRAAILLF
jgi:hypothetical protein